jgi:hypothetical protein
MCPSSGVIVQECKLVLSDDAVCKAKNCGEVSDGFNHSKSDMMIPAATVCFVCVDVNVLYAGMACVLWYSPPSYMCPSSRVIVQECKGVLE